MLRFQLLCSFYDLLTFEHFFLSFLAGPFFDRHRSDDPLLDDPGIGGRGSNGGRGVGSSDMGSGDGVRPFGGGRGKLAFFGN